MQLRGDGPPLKSKMVEHSIDCDLMSMGVLQIHLILQLKVRYAGERGTLAPITLDTTGKTRGEFIAIDDDSALFRSIIELMKTSPFSGHLVREAMTKLVLTVQMDDPPPPVGERRQEAS